MKNKIQLKKYLMYTVIITTILFIVFLILDTYEYNMYTKNFNNKISAIILEVRHEYPDVTENDIISILNNKKEEKVSLEKYGINLEKDSIILKNKEDHKKFVIINIIFFIVIIISIQLTFLKYNKSKDKEINKIARYIEEINKKNYKLHIDENSEDELSILKNEVYKTTIMLKEAADNSNKEKHQLKKSLEDISHQLKTPLTSILIMLDNIIDNPDMDAEIREDFIRDIKREIITINFFVQTILKLSKIDSNTIDFVKTENTIKEIIEQSIKKVSALCDLKNIKIEIEGNENSKIICDKRWQEEAISNIIKNCIDHSKENSKLIIKYDENEVYSTIIIKDFGEGISQKDLPHIFERFYKGENATSDSIGIGLSLAKAIIEEENGHILVDSDKNGTQFTIKYLKI